jgi:putative DNA primase/helicase
LVAYLLLPDNSLKTAFMFLGAGDNGKSTLIALIEALLGSENVEAIPLHKLEDDRFAAADLYGKLANTFADLDARALAATSMFKSITGGDSIRGEQKYRGAFKFRPYARLIYSANEAPPTPDGSDAFFGRWKVIPFEQAFTGREDRRLIERLTTPEELSGLLNMALLKLPVLRERGRFPDTDETEAAARQFRIDTDSAAGFIAERCVVEEEARVARARLYRDYKEWCQETGHRPFHNRNFNKRVRQATRGEVEERPIEGIYTWIGIGLGGAA